MSRVLQVQPRILLTLLLIGVFAYGVADVAHLPVQARAFPWALGLLALALLVYQLIREVRTGLAGVRRQEDIGAADIAFAAEEATPEARRKTLEIFAWIFGFVLALWLLGFLLAPPLMAFAYLRRHREGWLLSLLVPLGVWAVIWGVFSELMSLPFPRGQLFEWLR